MRSLPPQPGDLMPGELAQTPREEMEGILAAKGLLGILGIETPRADMRFTGHVNSEGRAVDQREGERRTGGIASSANENPVEPERQEGHHTETHAGDAKAEARTEENRHQAEQERDVISGKSEAGSHETHVEAIPLNPERIPQKLEPIEEEKEFGRVRTEELNAEEDWRQSGALDDETPLKTLINEIVQARQEETNKSVIGEPENALVR